jgi:FtsZ-binding cell division protein ZapB
MQRKTDKEVKNAVDRIDKTVTRIDEVVDKMNQITERQHDIITNEDERRKRMKSYRQDQARVPQTTYRMFCQ